MFNGTFLKPCAIDLLYRCVMYADGVGNFCFSFSIFFFFLHSLLHFRVH